MLSVLRVLRVLPQLSVRLSARDRRTLAGGMGVIVIVLVLFRGVPAWRTWVRESQHSAVELTSRLAVARQAAGEAHGAARVTDSLEQAYRALAPALLDGDTPAQATAALAAALADAAAAAGVRLSSTQLAADTAATGQDVYRVHTTVEATGDIRGVLTLLETLESSAAPLLAVQTLAIAQADPGAPANHPEVLHLSLEIEGLARHAGGP